MANRDTGRTRGFTFGVLSAVAALAALLASGAAPAGAHGAVRPAAAARGGHGGPQRAVQQEDGPTGQIADPGDVTVGALVTLDGGGSQGDIAGYTWDFGDGSAGGAGKAPRYAYQTVDDYTIKLTVQDRQGRSNSATRTIRVVPSLGELSARPVLGQITPASSFTALLALNASGPARLSAKIGGTYLFSDRWDFMGGSGGSLLEIPDVRVVNEDDADLADLLARRVDNVRLADNVTVTLSYAVSSGANESVTYTTSLVKPADLPPLTPAPAPAPIATATPTATPEPTAVPVGAGGVVASATPAVDGTSGSTPAATPATSDRAYRQASATPPPGTSRATPPPPPPPPPIPGATPGQPAATPAPAAAGAAATPGQPALWSITYPSYLPLTGLPANADDIDGYYITGDRDFHAASDETLRRWAIKIARNGGVFPNDPQRAADNIYRYVNGLLGIGDPGDLVTDLQIIGRILAGGLVPGARRGEYICIAHAYFVSSLARTLGLPTRELTIGFGRGISQDRSGAWNMNYYQEGANEVWYAGAWHHYDTWIGTRDRADYLATNLTEIAWYAFSPQRTPFLDVNEHPVGLAGHDFSLGKFVGAPGAPDQWRFLEQQTRPGVRIAAPDAEAYASTERALPAPRDLVVAGVRPAADPSAR